MPDRERPPTEADLYEARGVVPLARPIMQGDVFRDVAIPGFGEPPSAVMITQHPCSMRAGSALRSRLTVIAVRQRQKIWSAHWQGYVWAMLLPDLLGDGQDYHADFRDVGSVETPTLARSSRIAALTNYGVHVLHQRDIYYQTRFTVDIPTLAETFDPIATEIELQYEWVEAALGTALGAASATDTLDVINRAELEFGSYLDENNGERRTGIQQTVSRADVRRQVRREIIKRYGTQNA